MADQTGNGNPHPPSEAPVSSATTSANNTEVHDDAKPSHDTVPQQGKEQAPTSLSPEKQRESQHDPYPHGLKLFAIIIALLITVFLFALDQTIVATAIPRITDDFHALDSIGWIASGYFLTVCAFQPSIGSLYTIFRKKYVFLSSIFIFELGSLLCGVSPNINVLIFARCFQGLGAAGLYVGSLTIISDIVPLEKRPAYQGIIGAAFGISSIVGPLLGGAFTDNEHLTWRWCFYINLPVGGVAMIAVFFALDAGKVRRNQSYWELLKELDWIGAFILLGAVACLLVGLQYGGANWAWSSYQSIIIFVFAGVLSIVFTGIQIYKGDKAMIPPRLVKLPTMIVVIAFAFCLGISFFTVIYFLPLFFQAVMGVSATQSGIDILPLVIGVVVASIVSGIGMTKLGYVPPFPILGGALALTGVVLLHTLDEFSNNGRLYGYQVLAGLGFGFCIQVPVIAVQTFLQGDDIPIGTSVAIFSQTLSGAIGVQLGSTILNTQLVKKVPLYAPTADLGIVLSGATSLRKLPPELLPGVIHGYVEAIQLIYYLAIPTAALIVILSPFLKWVNIKGMKFESAAA